MSERGTMRVGTLLCQHLGLEIASIGNSSLVAAIGERTKARKMTVDEYAGYVEMDRSELAALVDAIIVPESWFFRDRVPFQHLASHASKLVRKGRRVRILSAPCSTGEEPYSVAMSLLEAGIDASLVTIDAIDVSPPLLVSARAGIYRPSSFRGVDEQLRTAYFTQLRDDRGWQLAEAIRAMVRFRAVNLLGHDALGGEPPFDIILCRNLLIYLTADARAKVLDRFVRLLADGGLLVVGHAEALEVIDKRFVNTGVASAFTYTLRGEEAPPRPPTLMGTPNARRPTPPAMAKVADTRRPTPPPMTRLADPVAGPVNLLGGASALADQGNLPAAAALVEQHLASAGADASAWALLGSIRQAGGDHTRAEECFSKAVYCDPTMYTALVQLALLLEKRGETKAAQQLRARAERAKGAPR